MTFDEWKDDYGLVNEPNYSEATEEDCKAAFHSRDAEVATLRELKQIWHDKFWELDKQKNAEVAKWQDAYVKAVARIHMVSGYLDQIKERDKLREQVNMMLDALHDYKWNKDEWGFIKRVTEIIEALDATMPRSTK